MIPKSKRRSPCAVKNDGLGWTCGYSFASGGVLWGMRSNSEERLEKMKQILPCAVESTDVEFVDCLYSYMDGGAKKSGLKNSKNYSLLYRDWTRLSRSLNSSEVERALSYQLESELILNRRVPCFSAALSGYKGDASAVVIGRDNYLQSFKEKLERAGWTLAEQDHVIWNLELGRPEARNGEALRRFDLVMEPDFLKQVRVWKASGEQQEAPNTLELASAERKRVPFALLASSGGTASSVMRLKCFYSVCLNADKLIAPAMPEEMLAYLAYH
jgi:hypothetical protein